MVLTLPANLRPRCKHRRQAHMSAGFNGQPQLFKLTAGRQAGQEHEEETEE